MTILNYFTVSTRYEGATNSHGSRIVVTQTIKGKRVQRTFPYDYAARDAHEAAARAFANSRGWNNELYGFRYDGETRSGRGKVLTLVAPE